MTTPDIWKKSSYSGGGEGNACIEIAHRHPRIAVRDSKAPERAVLTFPVAAFTAFTAHLGTTEMPRWSEIQPPAIPMQAGP